MNVPRQFYDPKKILGFKFISTNDIDHVTVKSFAPPKNVVEYLTTIVEILRQQALRIHVDETDWMLTVKIDVGKLSSTDFDLTKEQKLWLDQQGKKAVDKYILDVAKLIEDGKFIK